MADTNFAQPAILTEQSSAATPPANTVALYPKTDGRFYGKDDAGTEFAIGTIGGSVGAVDNAVPRADGTGGFTVQGSGLIIEDAIVSFTGITGTAGAPTPDVITATGSAFVSGQPVRFTALTGGSGLNTTTNYFVVNPSGATFQVETSIGGGAVNFTTDITSGTLLTGHSVQVNVTLSENTTETNSALVLTPKGTGALIAGPKPDGSAVGGNARGANALDLQLSKNGNTQIASGNNSVLFGRRNTASGAYSVCAGGNSNAAIADAAFVVGQTNRSESQFSSISGGVDGLANRYGMQAHAAGLFAAQGDAQRARFVLRCKTTTNAAVEMTLDGAAPGASNRLTIPAGKYLTGTINIAGIKSDGATAASYIRQFSIKHISATATTSLVGTVNTVGVDEAAGTTISITANDPNDALKVDVTGITSEIWRWVAAVDVVEVGYGT